ncbi:MAG: ABC transporter substrate-binding protein [Blastochloris sp.]|nr:ABC transporter substrate-binding protein [Blastochloris sp.]
MLAALEIEPIAIMRDQEALLKNSLYFAQPTKPELLDWEGDFPNLEKLAALKPDFVFGWQELSDVFKDIAPVYSVVDAQDSYVESHAEIRALAKLVGREDVAERNIQNALDRLAAYKAKSPKNVSVMYGFFYQNTFSYRDGQSGTCNLLKEIALCDWPDPQNKPGWSVEVGDEGLLKLDPDVLLVDNYGFDGKTDAQLITEFGKRPLWSELKALKDNRLYIAKDDTANIDGMGTIGMSRVLDVYAPLLYPDVFPQALTDEEVQEILKR